MINDCLRGYIGIPGCSEVEPESGKYITDHPGISLISFDKIADSDKKTWKSVWATIEKRGIDRLTSDLVSWFSKKYKIRKKIETLNLPQEVTLSITAADSQYKGFKIEFEDIGEDEGFSSLQIVRLQEIRFWSTGSASLEFIIKDLLNNVTLLSETKDVTAGWNTIFQNKEYSVYKLFVGVKADIDTNVIELDEDSCCVCSDVCNAEVKGFTIGGSEGTNTFGFSGEISTGCSYDGWMCQNKQLIKEALWYAEGIETLRERIYTDRLNKWTTVDRAIAKDEMLPDFISNYSRELEQIVSGVDLCDCCVECESQVSYQQSLM